MQSVYRYKRRSILDRVRAKNPDWARTTIPTTKMKIRSPLKLNPLFFFSSCQSVEYSPRIKIAGHRFEDGKFLTVSHVETSVWEACYRNSFGRIFGF